MAIKISKPPLPEEYLVDNRVYSEEGVFHKELERIFLRVWNFVCHESEIERPGDYLSTTVAGQPVIICRDQKGKVNAFYNTCRHRAARVVREARGHGSTFKCLYHHWTYGLDGRLVSAPEMEAYTTSANPGGLSREDFGLVPVRVGSLHRLVFVCFDDATPPLAEFLADVADHFKAPFSSPDLKVWVVRSKLLRANWKMQPENSRDGYHAALLHNRLRHVSPPRPYRLHPNGHAVQLLGLDYESGMQHQTLDPVLAQNPELTRSFMRHPLPGMTPENPAYVVTLFPDLLILTRFSTLLIERQIPLSPGETLVELRAGGLAGDTDEIKEIRERHWQLYWSEGSGNLPEDWEAWEAQQEGAMSVGVRYSLLARGEPAKEGLRGDDNRIRDFWKEWRRHMGVAANAPPEV